MKKKILGILGMGVIAASMFSVKPVYAADKSYSMSLAPYQAWRAVNAPDCKDYKADRNNRLAMISLNYINDADSYSVEGSIWSNPYSRSEVASRVTVIQGQKQYCQEYEDVAVGNTYFLALRNINLKSDYVVAKGTFNIF